jgi:lysophospholipase L1-like esterase
VKAAGTILICFLVLCRTHAQVAEVDQATYSFIPSDRNVIQNEAHLDLFFEKLYQLKATGQGQVNIVHIGDSHIQADFLTDIVRKNLQGEFGNAGRGLIVPGRVAGTNEPLNFRTSSDDKWISKRIIYTQQPLPIGIGGITLNTETSGARINIRMNDAVADYSFNRVTLFYQKQPGSFDFSIQDTLNTELGHINPIAQNTDEFVSSLNLPGLYSAISIQVTKPGDNQRFATLYGVNLENGKTGILYHAIGVNGAKYTHYNAARYFVPQTKALHPDLFIISLGTNESVEHPYLDRNFFQHVTKLVESLSAMNPTAAFILVSPPDAFLKKVKQNPGIEHVRNEIVRYAVENGLAFWDMYKVNGSAGDWRLQGLLRPDGIHFTKDGYTYQGSLLSDAIMKSYYQYVSARYP